MPDLRHFPVSQSINSSNMQSFDSTEETQESLVFRTVDGRNHHLADCQGGCTSSESGGAHFCYSRIDFWPRAFFVQSSMRSIFFQSISLTGFSSTAPSTAFFTAERDRLSKVDFSLHDMLTCSVSREGPFLAFGCQNNQSLKVLC